MSNIEVFLTKPHPYVVVDAPSGKNAGFYRHFSTQEIDEIDALIKALTKAKDLLLQAKRAA